ncbi:MAG: cell wall hydrolase, partial [Syntrophorhabdaceae bacterium]|nr:cell wall hydrolase [Syntrophorhabdaceae bacterium]
MIPKRPTECFLTLDDTQLLTLCIYGETGKKLVTGHQLGVASCVMNRARNLTGRGAGVTLKDVILAPRQFPCFQEGNPNRLGLMAIACGWDKAFQRNRHLRECFRIAEGVMNG